MGLFDETVRRVLLNEDFENGAFYVYHGTKPTAEEGIAAKGFERFFTNSNGGNMYGAGIYSTYKLSLKGQNARGSYGNLMFKMRVKSLRNFVIYDPDIAIKIYGTDDVDFQLKKILTLDQYNRIKNNQYFDFNKLINARKDRVSSVCALDMCEYFRHFDPEAGYKINGYIFTGNHDGYVCFMRDFKNAYPVKVSRDCGKTWEDFKGKETLQKYGIDDVDLKFQLGKHNYQLFKELNDVPYFFINGFAKVRKGDKFNYLYRQKPLAQGVISPVWFDFCPDTFTNRDTANVVIDDDTYILKVDRNKNEFYVYYADGTYLCKLDALSRVLASMKINDNEEDSDSTYEYEDDDFS